MDRLDIISYVVQKRSNAYFHLPETLMVDSASSQGWFSFIKSEYYPVGIVKASAKTGQVSKADHVPIPRGAKVTLDIRLMGEGARDYEPFSITAGYTTSDNVFWFQRFKVHVAGKVQVRFTCSDKSIVPLDHVIIADDGETVSDYFKKETQPKVEKSKSSKKAKVEKEEEAEEEVGEEEEEIEEEKKPKAKSSKSSSKAKKQAPRVKLEKADEEEEEEETEKEEERTATRSNRQQSKSSGTKRTVVVKEEEDTRTSKRSSKRVAIDLNDEEDHSVVSDSAEVVAAKPSVAKKVKKEPSSSSLSPADLQALQNARLALGQMRPSPPTLLLPNIKHRLESKSVSGMAIKGPLITELKLPANLVHALHIDRTIITPALIVLLKHVLRDGAQQVDVAAESDDGEHPLVCASDAQLVQRTLTPSAQTLFDRMPHQCVGIAHADSLLIHFRLLFEEAAESGWLFYGAEEQEVYQELVRGGARGSRGSSSSSSSSSSSKRRLWASVLGPAHFLRFIVFAISGASHPEGEVPSHSSRLKGALADSDRVLEGAIKLMELEAPNIFF